MWLLAHNYWATDTFTYKNELYKSVKKQSTASLDNPRQPQLHFIDKIRDEQLPQDLYAEHSSSAQSSTSLCINLGGYWWKEPSKWGIVTDWALEV